MGETTFSIDSSRMSTLSLVQIENLIDDLTCVRDMVEYSKLSSKEPDMTYPFADLTCCYDWHNTTSTTSVSSIKLTNQ